ncbi:Hypothetical predicted protein [Mytilus galloprovincialis]|uniref:Prolow-density lipoprotein receptor-related protein 1-like beta-propeller domain-containing protein n=1 Tax=Mytilus galloprovincialis TaxID=29158 RepID=A0A8B6HMK6_MYTGA|nr:Hypothetical predicted protein [Mytilus galloprovincialis]
MKLHQTMFCMLTIVIIIAGSFGIDKQKLMFSTYNYLKEIDLDTGVVQKLTSQNEQVYSLAYDIKERYMYVPKYDTGDIVRFSYPTNHTVMSESIVTTSSPFGISFDSVNRHLYWTELSSTGMIKRCNPDGSNVTVLLSEIKPTALALDIQHRWIYYGQEQNPSKIFRTNFDGMDKTIIINYVASYVYGIGVDVDAERLYWMEYEMGDLRSAWYNGSDVKTIISTNATDNNLNIDINGDFIFYTSNNQIMKIDKSLGQNPTVVHTDTEKIYGFLLYKQDGENTIIKIL